MPYRPRLAGHSRWDDPLAEPDAADTDIDLLPWPDDPPAAAAHQQARDTAQLAHVRAQLRRTEHAIQAGAHAPASDAPHFARLSRDYTLWHRLLVELERTEMQWCAGAGDRRLF